MLSVNHMPPDSFSVIFMYGFPCVFTHIENRALTHTEYRALTHTTVS